ncbi:MAG: hypothetical protein [Bacteriophage sp.]|nr:MAG: hypothetical protein [Bacteriophage sp.]
MSGKLHPLHEPEALLQGMLASREYPSRVRRTGRSTALALTYIAQAIASPYTPIPLRDHSHEHSESYGCRSWFAGYVVSTCQQLGLSHMRAVTYKGEFCLQFGK